MAMLLFIMRALLLLGLITSMAWTATVPVGGYFTLGTNQGIADWILRDGQVWVVYGASWCAPCKILDRNLAELLKEAPITVVYVDADEHRSLLLRNQIGSLPTLVFYLDGNRLNSAQKIDLAFLRDCYRIIQEAEQQQASLR
jgi:thioredoxin 1